MIEEGQNLPGIEDFQRAVDEATKSLTPEGRAATDQGIEHIRELSTKMCSTVTYGDETWKEVWGTATVTLYTLLLSMKTLMPDLPKSVVDGISMEFMLIGNGDKQIEIDGISLDTTSEGK